MDTGLWSLAIAGLLVLLSWIGLGWALHRLLRANKILRPHWSLFAASGMAVVLALGGVAMLCRVAFPLTLDALTLAGVVLAALAGWHNRARLPALARPAYLAWLPLVIAGAALYVASLYSAQLNPGDDLLAYMVFPTQLLQTGTLLDPFTMRRLGTYGGHALLQAQLFAAAQSLGGTRAAAFCQVHGHLLDTGLCTLISAGLIWSLFRPKSLRRQLLALLAVAAFFLMPIPRANTYAQTSGTLLFLALAQTLPRLGRSRSKQPECLAALFAAGVATLRMNFAAGAGIALALAAGDALFRRRRSPRAILRFALPLLLMLALLVPWAIVLYQSSGTLFYPLFRGFQQGAFLQVPMTLAAHFRWSAAALLYPKLLFALFPLFFAVLLRRRRDAIPLYIGALLMTAALAWEFTNEDTANIYRLSSPLLLACVWLTLSLLLKRWNRLAAPIRWGGLFLLFAAPCVGSHEFSDAFRFSYSLWIIPLVLAGPWIATRRSSALKDFLALLAGLLIAWLALHNRDRLSDNGTIFFFLAGILALAWTVWIVPRRPFRLIAAGLALILIALFVGGLSRIEGWPLLASMLALLAGLIVVFRPARRVRPLFRLPAALLILAIAAVDSSFIADHFALAIALAAIAAAAWAAVNVRMPLRRAALFFAIACLLPAAMPEVRALFAAWQSPRPVLAGYPAPLVALYHHAQDAIPPGAPFFALVPEPACLQFGRNRVEFADYQMHLVSPPSPVFPGLPVIAPAEKLRAYWKSVGIRYLMLSRDGMTRDGTQVPRIFQFNLDTLTHTQRMIFLSPHLTVLDLGPPPSPPSSP